MTTDIRDGVEWKPWYVRYAEYGGQRLVLIDALLANEGDPHAPRCVHLMGVSPSQFNHYDVVWLHQVRPCTCGQSVVFSNSRDRMYSGNDLTEALAAFHEAEEKLLRGDLVAPPGGDL